MTLALTHSPARLAWQAPLTAVRGDSRFYVFIAAYAAATWWVAETFGATRKMLPPSFYLGAADGVALLAMLALVATALWALKERSPLEAWGANLRAVSAYLPSTLLLLALMVFMGVFSSMKQMLTNIVPFYADPLLAHAGRLLHGTDPWRIAHAIVPDRLMPALEWVYLWAWGPALGSATWAALYFRRFRRLRAQYVWTYLLVWTLLGTVLAGAFMSAGPVFYREVTGDAYYADLLQWLAHTTRHEEWGRAFLWRSYRGLNTGIVGAGISAFPSMHVASATLCALVAASAGRAWRWLGVVYCAVILLCSFTLAWHYALDGYVSILATGAIWKAVGWALTDAPTAPESAQPAPAQ
jgi:hypothetical protein